MGALALTAPVRVLDVGAGDGWLSSQLERCLPAGSSVVCLDAHYSDRDLAEDGRRVRERPNETFDLVLMLDVLEHVADDEGFFGDYVETVMRPGARAIISVPAHPRVTSSHDDALGHQRRYRPTEISAMIRRHLQIEEDGSIFLSLLIVRALQRLAERVKPPAGPIGVGAWSAGPGVSSVLAAVLDVDTRVSHGLVRSGLRLPGLSYWAVARTATVTPG